MTTDAPVSLINGRRAVLTAGLAALMLLFTYGSTVETASDAVLAVVVFLVVGYSTLTVLDLLVDRILWSS